MKKLILTFAAVVLFVVWAPGAKAGNVSNPIVMSCAYPNCTGTVNILPSNNYSSSGIGMKFTADPFGADEVGEKVKFTFNTSSGAATLKDADKDVILTGTITNFSNSSFGGDTTLVVDITWTGCADQGTETCGALPGEGLGQSVVTFFLKGKKIEGAYGSIVFTPEPSSLLFLGTGLLAIGTIMRRRIAV
jgi:hypothetical protein